MSSYEEAVVSNKVMFRVLTPRRHEGGLRLSKRGKSGSPESELALIFPRVKRDKVKKNFSGMERKLRRLAAKVPRKRPVGQGNDTDIACIIPCKIRLNGLRVFEEQ